MLGRSTQVLNITPRLKPTIDKNTIKPAVKYTRLNTHIWQTNLKKQETRQPRKRVSLDQTVSSITFPFVGREGGGGNMI